MPVVDGIINLPMDGPGKAQDFSVVTTSLGTAYRERINIADAISNNFANVTSGGALQVDGSGVTQPVSGTVAISGSVAVTGTFYQATQPVSLTSLPALAAGANVIGHVIVDSAPTTAVTGTFWQVTQPVSGTVSANAGSGTFTDQHSDITTDYDTGVGVQNLTMFGLALPGSGGAVAGGTATNPLQISLANTGANATAIKVDGSAVTQPVSGTFWQSTQPVSLASLPALAAGSAVIGHVIVDSGAVNATLAAETTKVIGTINVAASQTIGLAAGGNVIGQVIVDSGTITAVTAITNALPAGTNVIGHVIVDSGSLTVAFGSAQHVIIDSAAAMDVSDRSARLLGHVTVDNPNTQYADNVASGSAPTGSLAMGWDSTNSVVRALKVDSQQNLTATVSGSVNDSPESYSVGDIKPLSLTPEGRLRVATHITDNDQVWIGTFDPAFSFDSIWSTEADNYF